MAVSNIIRISGGHGLRSSNVQARLNGSDFTNQKHLLRRRLVPTHKSGTNEMLTWSSWLFLPLKTASRSAVGRRVQDPSSLALVKL